MARRSGLGRHTAKPVLSLGLIGVVVYLCGSPSAFAPGLTRQNQFGCARSKIVRAARGGEASGGLAKGDLVKAICPDDDRWYSGVVDSLAGSGSFVVKWDDPDGGPETHEVKADAIKKIVIYKDYKVDETVLAVFPDDGNYYAGKVTKLNKDGTFGVKWEDSDGGPAVSEVQPSDMKYPPIPFDQLEVGQKYMGTVRTVRESFAFVDIGAETEGFLHVSKVSKERIENIGDHLQAEQEVEVWISGKKEDGKFGLTMVEGKIDTVRAPRGSVDLTPFQDLSPDEWINGVVSSTAPFGAFVTVTLPGGASADGLVHVSQLRDGFVENVDDEVSAGQEVKVRVQSVSDGKMSLSMKEAGNGGGRAPREAADLTAFQDISADTWFTGKVTRTAPFGAFVSISTDGGASAEGMVHITQIRDGFVENVEDEVSVDQEVQVRIQSVDTGSGKMSLSMKQPESE